MKTLLYCDCNDNACFLIELITLINRMSLHIKEWEVSSLDMVTKIQEDYSGVGGSRCSDIENTFLLAQKVDTEYCVAMPSDELIRHLTNVKTVYEGQFRAVGSTEIIIVYDGDIFELYGVSSRIINDILSKHKCKEI